MTPSWMMRTLAEERRRNLVESQQMARLVKEARETKRIRRREAGLAPRSWRNGFGVREWLGWRLVDLGVHLVVRPSLTR